MMGESVGGAFGELIQFDQIGWNPYPIAEGGEITVILAIRDSQFALVEAVFSSFQLPSLKL